MDKGIAKAVSIVGVIHIFLELYETGLQLATKIKSNMKNKLTDLADRILPKKGLL